MALLLRWPFVLLPIVVLVPLAIASVRQPVEQVEFLEGVQEHVDSTNGQYVIGTTGYWSTGPELSVSVSAEGNVSSVALNAARSIIDGTRIATNSTTFAEWNELLSSLSGLHAPTLKLAQEGNANIKVILTNSEHPEGKMGRTLVYTVKGTGEIISASVYVYSADRALAQGTLEKAVEHELGHALGLAHSTDPDSIMFPVLEVENGSISNHIGSCEERGISVLYSESKIGTTDC
jgi:hypothetical protein